MAKILIGNVKPVKGVDYFTPEDIEEMGKSFATKESVDNLSASVTAVQEDLEEIQEAVSGVEGKFAPAYTYGTDDLEAGTTPLETGKLHFVYEE